MNSELSLCRCPRGILLIPTPPAICESLKIKNPPSRCHGEDFFYGMNHRYYGLYVTLSLYKIWDTADI